MGRFIRADGDGAGHGAECLVIAGGQRLFDEFDAGIGAGPEHLVKVRGRPAFIGIDDEAAFGRIAADQLQAFGIALAAELQLEERAVGGFGRRLAHGLRRVEAQRIGGDDGFGLGEPCELPDGLSGLLRAQSQSAQSSAFRAAWGARMDGNILMSDAGFDAVRAASRAAITCGTVSS
jgi:hypothetical protein